MKWLQKIDRHLSLPKLMVVDAVGEAANIGGLYSHPSTEEEVHFGILIPPSASGTIIVAHFPDRDWDFASCLAHEYRHAWQEKQGAVFERSKLQCEKKIDYADPLWYEKHIIDYFTSSRTEMDALRFEVKYAPDKENLWRLAACEEYLAKRTILTWGG